MTRRMKLIEDDKWDFVMSKGDTHRLTGGEVDGLRGLGAGGQSDWSLLTWGKLNLCSVLRYLDRWETFEVSWRGKRTWTLCLCFERSGQLRGICPDRVFDINRVKKISSQYHIRKDEIFLLLARWNFDTIDLGFSLHAWLHWCHRHGMQNLDLETKIQIWIQRCYFWAGSPVFLLESLHVRSFERSQRRGVWCTLSSDGQALRTCRQDNDYGDNDDDGVDDDDDV